MFSGFTVSDFDCYETRKWKSNIYNRERMEIKQKLFELANQIAGTLLDLDGAPLFIEASVEHPALSNHKQVDAQHIFFSRPESARNELDRIIDRQKPMATLLDDPTPQRNHVFLAITLHYEGLEVSLKLHPDAWVDRQNLEHKLEDHYNAEKFIQLIQMLPPTFSIGLSPQKQSIVQTDGTFISLDQLKSILKELSSSTTENSFSITNQPARLFCLSQFISKEQILLTNSDSLSNLVSWIKEGLKYLLPIYHYIAWSRKNDFVSVKQVLDQEKISQKQKGIGKKDKVRVIRGLWAGKSGYVQEIDAKGQIRVMIGKMAVKIDATDVEKVDF